MDIVKLIDSSTKMGIPPSEVHSSDDMNDVSLLFFSCLFLFYLCVVGDERDLL